MFKSFLQYTNKLLINSRTKEVSRFFIIGLTAFLIDFILLNFQVYILGFRLIIFDFLFVPNFVSTATSIIYNFSLQKFWVFKRRSNYKIELLKFLVVHLVNLFLFNGFVFGAFIQLQIPIPIAKIIATTIQAVLSFVAYKFFVFKFDK